MLIVYFEDGPLVKGIRWRLFPQVNIDAANGVSYNLEVADATLEKNDDKTVVVYTNQILLLDSKYTYDTKTKMFHCYLKMEDGSWMNLEYLTDRELRPGHNIPKLYLAGEFYDNITPT